ncbi:MAG: FAD-dependent oxidoreductase [Nitriliruptorales bacterium]|nr:FAD-dependent oxidoreductase [Nitriliruptorales bacterium]
MSTSTGIPVERADAVVVGAGPGGSAAAYFLAEAGHDVVLIEKESFPRDKVCGDGLTPRAVKALQTLGMADEAAGLVPGWQRQEGLRMYGGGVVLDLPWPELADWPRHSLTATRSLFDHSLARNAAKAGAQLWEGTEVLGPVWLSDAERRVAGVRFRRADGNEGTIRAPIVLVADGGSSRFAVGLGLHRLEQRPMGVAVRAYYRSPRASMGMMEGFLELYRGQGEGGRGAPAGGRGSGKGEGGRGAAAGGRGSGKGEGGGRGADELLPGYGWIFPLDGGLVNVGWGLLNTSEHFRSTNYRKTLDEWVAGFPEEWEIGPETRVGRPRGAGLPMGHNRKPPLYKGAMLVGDSAGMVNPFNGEGISYAIEAAAFAVEAADAALRSHSDEPLRAYERAVADAWGGYYTLGRWFVHIIGHPAIMRFCTEFGMPRRRVMQFVFRLMAHLTDRKSSDLTDRVINALSRAVPAA